MDYITSIIAGEKCTVREYAWSCICVYMHGVFLYVQEVFDIVYGGILRYVPVCEFVLHVGNTNYNSHHKSIQHLLG